MEKGVIEAMPARTISTTSRLGPLKAGTAGSVSRPPAAPAQFLAVRLPFFLAGIAFYTLWVVVATPFWIVDLLLQLAYSSTAGVLVAYFGGAFRNDRRWYSRYQKDTIDPIFRRIAHARRKLKRSYSRIYRWWLHGTRVSKRVY